MVQLIRVLQLDQFVAPCDVTAEQPSVRDMSGVVFGVVQFDHEPLSPKLCQRVLGCRYRRVLPRVTAKTVQNCTVFRSLHRCGQFATHSLDSTKQASRLRVRASHPLIVQALDTGDLYRRALMALYLGSLLISCRTWSRSSYQS
jgi:hypothetical protein